MHIYLYYVTLILFRVMHLCIAPFSILVILRVYIMLVQTKYIFLYIYTSIYVFYLNVFIYFKTFFKINIVNYV